MRSKTLFSDTLTYRDASQWTVTLSENRDMNDYTVYSHGVLADGCVVAMNAEIIRDFEEAVQAYAVCLNVFRDNEARLAGV